MAQGQGKEKEVAALLARFPALITYVPTKLEVDFNVFMPLDADVYVIQPFRDLDPEIEAARAVGVADGRKAATLVPGRRFDKTGTRHGKGAGWYDRFLAQTPREWIRIGFSTEDQFSSDPLVRQPWDEPMDYVVVVPEDGSDPVVYETRARA